MTSASALASLDTVLEDFAEDDDTSWVPDFLGRSDYAEILLGVGVQSCDSTSLMTREIAVPRPSGTSMVVYDLPLTARLALHDATRDLRRVADDVLLPTVCGYRRGASDESHRSEYRRFTDLTKGMGEDADFVIVADVQQFFGSVSLDAAAKSVFRVFGTAVARPLQELTARFAELGISTLPSGYADARLLGNVVLHEVDSKISVPFTRWVDDYRLFVRGSEGSALEVLDQLSDKLSGIGLQLNRGKSHVTPNDCTHRKPAPLTSVYHPEYESVEVTRAGLRRVFAEAAMDAVHRRRELRFVLPRLSQARDSIAVDFALWALEACPWEAPRSVAYLANFFPAVEEPVRGVIARAAAARNSWLLARLAPLGCRMPLLGAEAHALRDVLRDPETTAISWGAALRMLACSGDREAVEIALAGPIRDHRVMLAALRDVGRPCSDSPSSVEAEPATATVVARMSDVPRPNAQSSL